MQVFDIINNKKIEKYESLEQDWEQNFYIIASFKEELCV